MGLVSGDFGLPWLRDRRFGPRLGCAALLGLAVFSGNVAASGKPQNVESTSADKANSAPRVFSKEKPLLGPTSTIPSATPDRSGRTRVEVIVEPDKSTVQRSFQKSVDTNTDARNSSPVAVSSSKSRLVRQSEGAATAASGLRQSPRLVREGTQRKTSSDPAVASTSKATVNSKDKSDTRTRNTGSLLVDAVPLPIAKPARRSPYRSAYVSRPRGETPQTARGQNAIGRKQANGPLDQRAVKQHRQRRLYRRLRPHNRHQIRRARRSPHWRRHAPPGTVYSFVRCRPGEPCIRYYRVKRPRTERQYRRLLAWQRRQDARWRSRRYYRRY